MTKIAINEKTIWSDTTLTRTQVKALRNMSLSDATTFEEIFEKTGITRFVASGTDEEISYFIAEGYAYSKLPLANFENIDPLEVEFTSPKKLAEFFGYKCRAWTKNMVKTGYIPTIGFVNCNKNQIPPGFNITKTIAGHDFCSSDIAEMAEDGAYFSISQRGVERHYLSRESDTSLN